MIEYWTILDFSKDELLGIMECEHGEAIEAEICAINNAFNLNRQQWYWGKKITKAEFETYQVFDIKEIKL